jgi:hypothetical protein
VCGSIEADSVDEASGSGMFMRRRFGLELIASLRPTASPAVDALVEAALDELQVVGKRVLRLVGRAECGTTPKRER